MQNDTVEGQFIYLTPSCLLEKGVILHEILHALGMFHEQSRPDRDDYVNLYRDNIWDGETNLFF